MSILSNVQLIERINNIETYIANLRIVVKKIITNDLNEALLYKLTLLELRKTRKIYDVIQDKNIIYIYLDPRENINDLIFKKFTISKEAVNEGLCNPISFKESNELYKKEASMCKIKFIKKIDNKLYNSKGTGFFLEINLKDLPFNKCLITNNHVINNEFFEINKEIKFDYNNKEKKLEIKNRKIYTNQNLDYTCIQIFDNDNIPQFFYINPQILTNSLNIFKNKDIFILQYPEGGLYSFSVGKIIGIDYNNNIIHNCPTLQGASGSPIILRNDLSVIGLHYGSTNPDKIENNISLNLATSINSIISDLKSIFEGKGNLNLKPIPNLDMDYLNNIVNRINDFNNNINNEINKFNEDHNNNQIDNKIIGYNINNPNYTNNKTKNYIVAEFSVSENDVFKNMIIINSYEEFKKHNPSIEFNKKFENEKELMKNCQLEMDNKILPFTYSYEFNTLNLTIKYLFKKNINMKFIFAEIRNLIKIDLSNFNSQDITNMSNMFQRCNKL